MRGAKRRAGLPVSPSAGCARKKVSFSESTEEFQNHGSYERLVSRSPASTLMRLKARAEFRKYTICELEVRLKGFSARLELGHRRKESF